MPGTMTMKKTGAKRDQGALDEPVKACFDCKRELPFYSAFRPRWRGCEAHALPSGRRVFHPECDACLEILWSPIRQSRCVQCDKVRMDRRAGRLCPFVPARGRPRASLLARSCARCGRSLLEHGPRAVIRAAEELCARSRGDRARGA